MATIAWLVPTLREERWEATQRMEAMVRERDETIASQAQMIEERWAAMQQMGQEIGNRDRWITELQNELQEAKRALFSLRANPRP